MSGETRVYKDGTFTKKMEMIKHAAYRGYLWEAPYVTYHADQPSQDGVFYVVEPKRLPNQSLNGHFVATAGNRGVATGVIGKFGRDVKVKLSMTSRNYMHVFCKVENAPWNGSRKLGTASDATVVVDLFRSTNNPLDTVIKADDLISIVLVTSRNSSADSIDLITLEIRDAVTDTLLEISNLGNYGSFRSLELDELRDACRNNP